MEIFERKPNPQKRLDEFGAGIPIEKFDWKAYNNSQTKEKIMFIELINDLCKVLDNNRLAHKIFCICMKVYVNTSSRRVLSELELCRKKGWLTSVPHFNTILNYLDNRETKRALSYLIQLSALPLAQLEKTFAVDSTGFSEHKYAERWSAIRQDYQRHREYRKAHCIYGVYSNIVTSAIVTDGTASDTLRFKELLSTTAKNFDVQEVVADLAYSSRENLKYASQLGITPFIPFKKNAVGNSKGAIIWNKMYKYFTESYQEFMSHYHKRSNAESGFFMIKQRFGDFVSTKNTLSQDNEVLTKILCHNICILIQEVFLSGLDLDFLLCAEKLSAQG